MFEHPISWRAPRSGVGSLTPPSSLLAPQQSRRRDFTMRQTVFEPAWLDDLAEIRGTLTPAQLAEVTAGFVFRPDLWRPLVHHDRARRWFERLLLTSTLEVWLIGWAAGQETSVHDHGGASGGLTVAEGALAQDVLDFTSPGSGLAFF